MQPAEFRTLALGQVDAVYRLASHLARDPDDANDLAQETYLRAFRSAASFRPTEHGIRPWLFKILHNALNDRLALEYRDRVSVDGVRHEPSAAPAAAPPTPDDAPPAALDWDDVDQRLKCAIHELPVPHRTTFLLCAVEGLSYREIASVMDVPVGTVMSRLHRARATLAARLTELAAERGLSRAKSAGNDGMKGPA